MKRLETSIVSGIFLPWLLGLSSTFLMDVVDVQWKITWLDWLANILLAMVAWPLVIVSPLMPSSNSPNPMAPDIRMGLIGVAILLDVLAYSFMTYSVLNRASRRLPTPPHVEQGR